jgi:hypothetical protein
MGDLTIYTSVYKESYLQLSPWQTSSQGTNTFQKN